MDNCSRSPCVVYSGQDARVQFDFRAVNGPHRQLRPVVLLGHWRYPYDLPQQLQNACALLRNAQCPLSRNQDATIDVVLPISPMIVPMRLAVEVALVDENQRTVFCNVIDVEVRARF